MHNICTGKPCYNELAYDEVLFITRRILWSRFICSFKCLLLIRPFITRYHLKRGKFDCPDYLVISRFPCTSHFLLSEKIYSAIYSTLSPCHALDQWYIYKHSTSTTGCLWKLVVRFIHKCMFIYTQRFTVNVWNAVFCTAKSAGPKYQTWMPLRLYICMLTKKKSWLLTWNVKYWTKCFTYF